MSTKSIDGSGRHAIMSKQSGKGKFLGKAPYGLGHRSLKSEESYISRIVWHKITKFYSHIHTDLPYICTNMTSLTTAQKLPWK